MNPSREANPPAPQNTLAILVTYHPPEGLSESLRILRAQVARVVVVDNHSTQIEVQRLRDLVDKMNGTIIANNRNLGIAAALNQGIALARTIPEIEWLWFFDQDSLLAPDAMLNITTLVTKDLQSGDIGIIGCNYVEPGTKRIKVPAESQIAGRQLGSNGWIEREYVITSGSLCQLGLFSSVGLMREEFFIDYVDYDFCLRVRRAGWRIVATSTPYMMHSVGNESAHRLGRRTLYTSNHSPKRRYYMTRNHIVLIKEQFASDWRWAVRAIRSRVASTIKMCLFEDERYKKSKYVARGVWDGLRSDFRFSPLSEVGSGETSL